VAAPAAAGFPIRGLIPADEINQISESTDDRQGKEASQDRDHDPFQAAGQNYLA